MHTQPNIGIGAVILNNNNEILLILRKKEPEANKWSIPGGKVELFEHLEDAVVREIKEEVNLDVEIEELLCTTETIDSDLKQHWISIIYKTKNEKSNPKNNEPDKIGDMQWFSLNKLPKEIACFAKPAIEKIKNRILN
jgi:8-oxo-dGTP diphosphatase